MLLESSLMLKPWLYSMFLTLKAIIGIVNFIKLVCAIYHNSKLYLTYAYEIEYNSAYK